MNHKNSQLICLLLAGVLFCSSPSATTAFVLPAANRPATLKNRFTTAHAIRSDLPAPGKRDGVVFAAGLLRAAAASSSPGGGSKEAEEYTVFDAEGEMSWEEYKNNQPDEYKLSETDKMLCWENDECPVEDESKYTKAWQLRSAERNPTTETHFDSEGDWEEENKSAWSKKWHEDVGADDLHEEPNVKPQGYNI